jgi:hypothetical protein
MNVIQRIGVFTIFMSVAVCQAPATLVVGGVNGTSAKLTLADLAKLPQHTVKTTDHGTPVTFQGVLLADVLAKVALPTSDQFHRTAASHFLLVEAQDGYRVVFAWAELDPSFMDKAIYVATSRDGKPLSEKEGPFRLVAPGEKRPARWAWQVTALRIKQAN